MRKTKRINIKELAAYFKVHRNTMAEIVKQARVDLKDPYSLINFLRNNGVL